VSAQHDAAYDVLIIGARVAGASLASLLGALGHRVLLVDRERFPSDTLSTHYMAPSAVPLLAELGVLGAVEQAGFRRLTRAHTWVADCLFAGPIAPPGGYALAPRRDTLDALLIERAVATGAVTLRTGARAIGPLWAGGRLAGATLRSGGVTSEVRARVVIGADGKHSAVAGWVGAACALAAPPVGPSYYRYYRGLAPLDEPALEVAFSGPRTTLLFPMRPAEDCLVVALPPSDFAAFRADPCAALDAHLRALPHLAARLRGAVPVGPIRGTRGVANYVREPYGPGWALVGDAACLKDPSTGTGMADAIRQAQGLAGALDAYLRGADWAVTMGAFRRRRDAALLPSYHAAIAAASSPDIAEDALAWLRAAVASPVGAYPLATAMPAALRAALPAAALERLAAAAAAFRPTAPS